MKKSLLNFKSTERHKTPLQMAQENQLASFASNQVDRNKSGAKMRAQKRKVIKSFIKCSKPSKNTRQKDLKFIHNSQIVTQRKKQTHKSMIDDKNPLASSSNNIIESQNFDQAAKI